MSNNSLKLLLGFLSFTLILSACTRTIEEDDATTSTIIDEIEQTDPSLTDTLTITNQPMQYESAPDMILEEGKEYFATLKTNMGDIKIKLAADKAPNTVNNFVFLSNEDFYDGVIFHRVIGTFMIQGGDPEGTGMGGPGYRFEDEFAEGLSNTRGTISMANAGPNTNGSQFFINLFDDNVFLDGRHAVFGEVVEGMDVVDSIAQVETDASDRPLEEVVIEDVVIETN